jgi:YspA SLOG family
MLSVPHATPDRKRDVKTKTGQDGRTWRGEVIVSWTGHRPDLFADPSGAQAAVVEAARELHARGRVERFLVGGQRGVDTWAAQAAQQLDVPFTLILPLEPRTFAADWSSDDRVVLETLTQAADRLRVVGGEQAAAFTERNRLLATSGDLLIAVWTGRGGGGTAETVAFARQVGTRVREIRLPASAAAASAVGRGI